VGDARACAPVTAVFGHRGCTEGFVENTIEAFLEAHRVGADGVEFDVRRSADGALVIHHDAEVEGVGLIPELAVGDLPAHVPLFAAVIEACAGMEMNVEVKNTPGDPGYDPSGSLARAVAAELVEQRRLDGVIVSSFDAPTIEAVRAAEPALPVGLLVGVTASLPDAAAVALDRGYQAIHPFFAAVKADFVARCHEAGLGVNVWTPNADPDLEAMLDAGVDILITDRLSAALALVAGGGPENRREGEWRRPGRVMNNDQS
jgi:glycerophosphoryl diester phosphodiesterase